MSQIVKNTILLIFVEILIVIFLFIIVGLLTSNDNMSDLNIKQKFITLLSFVLMFFFYGLIAKLVLEFIPKILIQKYFVIKHISHSGLLRLWLLFLVYGSLVSLLWWSQVGFKFKLNLNSSIAIFNLIAIAVAPFTLKKLGWDIIEKVKQSRKDVHKN